MIAYILSHEDFSALDAVTVSDYTINESSDFTETSQIELYRKPNAEEDDFIILREGASAFYGIINGITSNKGELSCTLQVVPVQALFNRNIVCGDTSLLSTGIEDFIAGEIIDNYVASTDTFLNLPYLSVTIGTHTPLSAPPETDEGGIYNLLGYIGQAMTNYSVFLEYTFNANGIIINIAKRAQTSLDVDGTLPNVYELNEVYEIDALAKLTVRWSADPDGVFSTYAFYLKTDGTITTNPADPDRAKGTVSCITSTASTYAEMLQQAQDAFTSNSYQHRVSFKILPNQIAPADEFYIGRRIRIKTDTTIKETIITRVSRNRTNTLDVTLGNLKVTLLEKLRGGRK